MELMQSLTSGIRATVTDEHGAPLREATVKIGEKSYNVSKNMAYFKTILVPGVYTLTVSCEGYSAQVLRVRVEQHSVTDVMIKMNRDVSADKNVTQLDEHRKVVLEKLNFVNRALSDLNAKYPRLTTLHIIGRTAKGNEIMCLEIGSDNDGKRIGRPSIAFLAGVSCTEPVTSEVLLYLASFLLDDYKQSVGVKNYVDNFSIYIVPDFSPDRNCSRDCSPRLEGSQFPLHNQLDHEATVIVNWFRKVNAVLAINLNSGSRHIEIPYGSAYKRTGEGTYKSADEDLLRRLASRYVNERAGKPSASSKCKGNFDIGDNSVIHAREGIGGKRGYPLMDYVYFNTSTLLMDVYVTCCTDDPSIAVWRENQNSLLACINEIGKSVKGHILNEDDEPIEDAVLSYDESPHSIKAGTVGSYFILLQPGSHNVTATAPGYIGQTKLVSMSDMKKPSMVIFKLIRNDNIMGMPRLVFIMMTGELIVKYTLDLSR